MQCAILPVTILLIVSIALRVEREAEIFSFVHLPAWDSGILHPKVDHGKERQRTQTLLFLSISNRHVYFKAWAVVFDEAGVSRPFGHGQGRLYHLRRKEILVLGNLIYHDRMVNEPL